MTRWKREPRHTIRIQHAHNHWSLWCSSLLEAAEDLGLPVGRDQYPNCSGDGSWDEEWYTSAAALARVGGKGALLSRAREIHETHYVAH